MKQFILKIPMGETIEDLSDDAKKAVQAVGGQFPSGRVVGSHDVLGYELKLVLCSLTTAQLTYIFNVGYSTTNENGDPILIDLGLDWEVLAEEGGVINQSLILTFLDDDLVYEDDEIVDTIPKTDLSSLQTYAGRSWD